MVEETRGRVPGENQRPTTSHWLTLSHICQFRWKKVYYKENNRMLKGIMCKRKTVNETSLKCQQFANWEQKSYKQNVREGMFKFRVNLLEIRLPKKCSTLSNLVTRIKIRKVFWIFKIWPQVHFNAYFGMDRLCQTKMCNLVEIKLHACEEIFCLYLHPNHHQKWHNITWTLLKLKVALNTIKQTNKPS